MRPVDAALQDLLAGMALFIHSRITARGLKYSSIHEAVLKEGIVFPHDPYLPEEEDLLLDVFQNSQRWAPKECFYNAQVVATQDERLGYAEGYVLAHVLPVEIEHGWNFLPGSGKPVDVTLRELGEKPTCDPAELVARAKRNLAHAYRGVPVPADEVRKHWLRTKQAGALLFDFSFQRKILRHGFPAAWR